MMLFCGWKFPAIGWDTAAFAPHVDQANEIPDDAGSCQSCQQVNLAHQEVLFDQRKYKWSSNHREQKDKRNHREKADYRYPQQAKTINAASA